MQQILRWLFLDAEAPIAQWKCKQCVDSDVFPAGDVKGSAFYQHSFSASSMITCPATYLGGPGKRPQRVSANQTAMLHYVTTKITHNSKLFSNVTSRLFGTCWWVPGTPGPRACSLGVRAAANKSCPCLALGSGLPVQESYPVLLYSSVFDRMKSIILVATILYVV